MKHRLFSSFILLIALVSMLSCQIANAISASQTTVLPTEPPVEARATTMPPIISAATPTQGIAVLQPTQVVVLATLPAIPTAQPPVPPAPLTKPSTTPPPGCTNPNATITSLTDNGTVAGMIEIKGTAADPNMEYWKVEYRPEANSAYDQLNKSDKGITDDVLARLSTKTVANGIYYIRLVVVKKDGNFGTPCEFRVKVQN